MYTEMTNYRHFKSVHEMYLFFSPKSEGLVRHRVFVGRLGQVRADSSVWFLYLPHNEVIGGYNGFTSSVCPSVCLSAGPPVRPSRILCPLCSAYCSGWIHSYLCILSSNFRRCVAWKVSCKIPKFDFFFNLQLWRCLLWTWDLMWIISMGNHGAVCVGVWVWVWVGWGGGGGGGVSQNAGILVVQVLFAFL